jgi:hypothetical protein
MFNAGIDERFAGDFLTFGNREETPLGSKVTQKEVNLTFNTIVAITNQISRRVELVSGEKQTPFLLLFNYISKCLSFSSFIERIFKQSSLYTI